MSFGYKSVETYASSSCGGSITHSTVTAYALDVCYGTDANTGTMYTACSTDYITSYPYTGTGKGGTCASDATKGSEDKTTVKAVACSGTTKTTITCKPKVTCETCSTKGASALAVSAAAAVAMISLY